MDPARRERAVRLARVIALEIDGIVRRLVERRDVLVQVWSRHRSRDGFRDTLFNRWPTVPAGDLADLGEAIWAVHAFYEAVSDLSLYLRYTDDMPATLGDRYDLATHQLVEIGREAMVALQFTPNLSAFAREEGAPDGWFLLGWEAQGGTDDGPTAEDEGGSEFP